MKLAKKQYDKKIIEQYLKEQINCINSIRKTHVQTITQILNLLKRAKDNNKKIYLLGNGGSASTATHFASDLLKTSITKKSKRFKAVSLCDNVPVVLAWANDFSFEDIFISQLENFLEKDDIVIGISGSGNSKNVIKGIAYANKIKAKTISLTGKGGGKLAKISNVSFTVPSNEMLTIETIHLLICHLLITLLRKEGIPLFVY